MRIIFRDKIFENSSAYVPGGLRLDGEEGDSGARDLIVRCCGYMPRNRNWNFAQVFSPFWRLYCNFAPGHHITHENRAIPLLPGRFVLIPENVLFHCHSPAGALGHLYIHFNLLPGRAPRLDVPAVIVADTFSMKMARELCRTVAKSRADRTAHQAAALLHWVFGNLASGHPIARLPSLPLRRVLAFVESHLGGDLSNAALSHVAAVSVRGLVRIYHRELHTTPQSYVREMRLREAARRLVLGRETIDRIADDLGFPNRFYFTRCFTQYLGCPPGEFRMTCGERAFFKPS